MPISIFEQKIFGQIGTIARTIPKINFENEDKVPILFIMAYEEGTTKIKTTATGTVAFLQKLFSEKNLLGAIYKGFGQIEP